MPGKKGKTFFHQSMNIKEIDNDGRHKSERKISI